jgi:hypothetical protein
MEPHDLQMVIAVNENKRSRPWTLNFDHTVSGSVDRFHFKLAAYYFENGHRNGNGRPRLAEILCPFALGAR